MLPRLGPSHVDPAVSQVVYKPVEGLTGLPKGSEHQALHPLVGEQLCLHRANQANSCPDILLVCLPGLAYILLVKLVISNVLISICYALKSILSANAVTIFTSFFRLKENDLCLRPQNSSVNYE